MVPLSSLVNSLLREAGTRGQSSLVGGQGHQSSGFLLSLLTFMSEGQAAVPHPW